MKKLSLILIFASLLGAGVVQECFEGAKMQAPNLRFEFNAQGGVATDLATGLKWMRCPLGQDYDKTSSSCKAKSNFLDAYAYKNFEDALKEVKTLNANGGYEGITSWRLPNAKEIFSLIESSCIKPALNARVFPIDYIDDEHMTKEIFFFWTSTPIFMEDTGMILVFASQSGSVTSYAADEGTGFGALLVSD